MKVTILDVVKLVPADDDILIRSGTTDNQWPVKDVLAHYQKIHDTQPQNMPIVTGITSVYEPDMGDTKSVVRFTVEMPTNQ